MLLFFGFCCFFEVILVFFDFSKKWVQNYDGNFWEIHRFALNNGITTMFYTIQCDCSERKFAFTTNSGFSKNSVKFNINKKKQPTTSQQFFCIFNIWNGLKSFTTNLEHCQGCL